MKDKIKYISFLSFHPDFDFSIGECIGISPAIYHKVKLNSYPKGWEEIVAKILYQKFYQTTGKQIITVDDIYNFEIQGKFYFECHMPSLIPLSYVKKIVISENNYNLLSTEQKTRLNYLLRNRINIVHVNKTSEDVGQIEAKSKFYLEPENNSERKGKNY